MPCSWLGTRADSSPCVNLQTLIASGIPEHKITFLNVISCPEGIHALFDTYPRTFW